MNNAQALQANQDEIIQAIKEKQNEGLSPSEIVKSLSETLINPITNKPYSKRSLQRYLKRFFEDGSVKIASLEISQLKEQLSILSLEILHEDLKESSLNDDEDKTVELIEKIAKILPAIKTY